MTATVPHTPVEFNQLVVLFKVGRYAEVESRTRMLLAQYPDYGIAWKLLSACLQMQGQDALQAWQKTTELLPDDAEAHNNLGIAQQDIGQLDSAVLSCHQALQIKPDYAEAHNNLGNAMRDLGQIDEAVACFKRALAINPGYAVAHNNLGKALKDLGQLDEAVACFKQALTLNPNYADAHSNHGIVLHAQGRPDEAAVCNTLALALALNIIGQSLEDKKTREAKSIFVRCVTRLRFAHATTHVREALIRALSEPWTRPIGLALAGATLAKLDKDIGECVARSADAWPRRLTAQDLYGVASFTKVATDPLLRAILRAAPICDIPLERFLTMTRRAMLDVATGVTNAPSEDGTILGFCGALARQCFINEYVFAWADDEAEQARALRDALVAALETNSQIPALWPLAVAAYFPLRSLPLATRLLDRQWPEAVAAVLVQQVREPEEELQLRTAIPRLTDIEDEVSLLVQNQYEENPYPRWIFAEPAKKPWTIDIFLRQRFPLISFRPLGNGRAADILVAGCGTGQHPLETAQRFRGAQVLAIDLSLTSLCYARRKMCELGLTTIEYAQADIMKLGSLGRSFDLIESVGVLHHLADPWAGWRVLLSLLRPGGFMLLGFYSEVARRNIVRIRTFIAAHGYGSTAEDIRRCRQDLVDLDKSANFGTTLKSSDFFSISTCRDLLFHVQEHRMTLSGIDAFLLDNGLQFLGFHIADDVLNAYRLRFPEDVAGKNLAYWQVFENENPDTFIGMYQFWIQKAC